LPKENPQKHTTTKAAHLKAKPIGTGLSSTLLSSQRTTTHRDSIPSPGNLTSGQPNGLTRSTSSAQDLKSQDPLGSHWHRPNVYPRRQPPLRVNVVGLTLQTGR
jgi:hypothetical protein